MAPGRTMGALRSSSTVTSLEEMSGQVEESEEIDVIAREFVIKEHVRKKYRCPCGECIETAPLPPRLVPGGRYSLAFAVAVAVSKYADHLPLERQVRIMQREGLIVDPQTLPQGPTRYSVRNRRRRMNDGADAL